MQKKYEGQNDITKNAKLGESNTNLFRNKKERIYNNDLTEHGR